MRKPALYNLLAIWTVALVTQIWIIGLEIKAYEPHMPSPLVAIKTDTVNMEAAQVKSEKQEIMDYIIEVFGDDAMDAFLVLSCENKGLRPDAVNTSNSNGSIDEGIFQINSIHGQEDMQDWHKNIDYAYTIFERQGWSPWSCSHKVGVVPFYLK